MFSFLGLCALSGRWESLWNAPCHPCLYHLHFSSCVVNTSSPLALKWCITFRRQLLLTVSRVVEKKKQDFGHWMGLGVHLDPIANQVRDFGQVILPAHVFLNKGSSISPQLTVVRTEIMCQRRESTALLPSWPAFYPQPSYYSLFSPFGLKKGLWVLVLNFLTTFHCPFH